MVTSSKGSVHTLPHSVPPDPVADHRQPMPSPETPGHSQASLVSLLWGHCSFHFMHRWAR